MTVEIFTGGDCVSKILTQSREISTTDKHRWTRISGLAAKELIAAKNPARGGERQFALT
jgi:hypothetical protein